MHLQGRVRGKKTPHYREKLSVPQKNSPLTLFLLPSACPLTSFSPLSQLEDKASSCVCFMVVECNQHTILRDVQKLMTYFFFLNAPFHFYAK